MTDVGEIIPERIPHHGWRIFAIWLALTAIGVPLIVLVLGPHLPPGRMSAEAGAQTDANVVMTALTYPIMLAVVVYFIYSFIFFRSRTAEVVDGPPIKGHAGMQLLWIVFTGLIVISLAAWGSYTLVASSHGAGGGQGPNPAAKPDDAKGAFPIQVIGQQWEWTFRYPQFKDSKGNVLETRDLVLPTNHLVAFHVTSLDVTHSFWAYELGVKADAVPGVDNIAYVNARKQGFVHIRCAELCGLWHGHMSKTGRVLSLAAYQAWGKAALKRNAPILKYLPPYNPWYFPAPLRRAG